MIRRMGSVKSVAVIFISAGVYCQVSRGATLIVGKPNTPCPNAVYSTITAAISAASPGDTIEVCPALYSEQLVISKPLALIGIGEQGVDRILIQPSQFQLVANTSSTAVITVMNTSNVSIHNIAVDASKNAISGCSISLSGIHFFNASGTVDSVAISGTRLANNLSCTDLFPGNGFGVQIDENASVTGTLNVNVRNSSIHEFSRDGILAMGPSENVMIQGNSIAGVGPSTGVNQFGIFLANGASGRISGNSITQGRCGAVPVIDCLNARSEGVVLRSAGAGTVVDGNTISDVQAGVFLNSLNGSGPVMTNVRVTNNVITNVDVLSGIQIQGVSSSSFIGNRIFNATPIENEVCGIADIPGTGSSGNLIINNFVNDAYCGVLYVTSDQVHANDFFNTLYETLNGDNYPDVTPPPVEPGQIAPAIRSSILRRY